MLFRRLISVEKGLEIVFHQKYKNQKVFEELNRLNWPIYPTKIGRVPELIELMNIFDNGEEEY